MSSKYSLIFYTSDGFVAFNLTSEEYAKIHELLYVCDSCEGYHVKPDGHADALALGEVLASVASRKEVEW
jgi:hypothetical protein